MSRWKNKKVGELFDVQLGKMLSKKAKQGELFPYLANFNVRWGSFDLSRMNAMNFSNREMAKYQLKKNDILMCEGGEIGRCAVWKEDDSQIFFQKALHRLRARSQHEINPYFFYAYMQHICSNNSLVKLVGETSIAHLTREKLIELKFPIPEKTHQDQIVKILATWDTAIEKTDALIAAKERQFGWLATRLINKSGYKKKQLSDFISEISLRNRGNEIDRVLSVTNRRGFVLPEDQFERRVASSNVSNYKIVKQGQYAYNPSRINVGSIARLDDWNIGILSPMYIVFNLDESVADSDYFLHWLSATEAKQRIKKSAQGSVREIVSFGDLGVIPICLPELPVQKNITNILNTAQQEITLLKNLATQYRTQKRGLMQKLLSGEWQLNPKEEKQ